MTPTDLKYNVLRRDPDSHFFDRKTMKFFGDTMANFRCCSTTILTNWDEFGSYIEPPVEVEVWCLYRKRNPKGLSCYYFDKQTFEQVYEAKI
jgi:hypothetical protein